MLPQATTAALLCGLLALCVGLTHASIAAAFESTPSSSFDHGGDFVCLFRFSLSPFVSPPPPCSTFAIWFASASGIASDIASVLPSESRRALSSPPPSPSGTTTRRDVS